MDNRKPVFELAVIGMLMLQFLLFSVLAWKMIGNNQTPANSKDQERIAELESKLERITMDQGKTMRENAYREVLSTLVATQTGDADLVDEFANLHEDRKRMQANLEGQLALAEKLQFERNSAQAQLDRKSKESEKLDTQLTLTRTKLNTTLSKYDSLVKTTEAAEESNEAVDQAGLFTTHLDIPWWWLAIGTVVVGLLGSALGYSFGRRDDSYSLERPNQREAVFPQPPSEEQAIQIVKQETENIALTNDGNRPPSPPKPDARG